MTFYIDSMTRYDVQGKIIQNLQVPAQEEKTSICSGVAISLYFFFAQNYRIHKISLYLIDINATKFIYIGLCQKRNSKEAVKSAH